jgi:hypothetical protein
MDCCLMVIEYRFIKKRYGLMHSRGHGQAFPGAAGPDQNVKRDHYQTANKVAVK